MSKREDVMTYIGYHMVKNYNTAKKMLKTLKVSYEGTNEVHANQENYECKDLPGQGLRTQTMS